MPAVHRDASRSLPGSRNAVELFIERGLAPAFAPWLKETWGGLENIPSRGSVVVAGNHLSNADAVVIGRFLLIGTGRMPRFLGKAEVFAVPVLGRLLQQAGQIPVQRGSSRAVDSFSAALEALDRGEMVSLLPEGTLTRDPGLWPMAGKTGAARLALASGAPLIPVAMWGPERILPPRQFSTRILFAALRPQHPVTVVAGSAVDLDDLRVQEPTPAVLTEATARLMSAITELLAQVRGSAPTGGPMNNPRVVSKLTRRGRRRTQQKRHSA